MCIRDRNTIDGSNYVDAQRSKYVVPDNWENQPMYNLPLDELIGAIDYAPVSYTHLDVYKRQDKYGSKG